jgi:hypothetical protein
MLRPMRMRVGRGRDTDCKQAERRHGECSHRFTSVVVCGQTGSDVGPGDRAPGSIHGLPRRAPAARLRPGIG